MHLTVVFDGHEAEDLSYGLVFTPVPTWIQGEREIAVMRDAGPHFVCGNLQPLLDAERIEDRIARGGSHSVAIVTHSSGHATPPDLAALVSDLHAAGFRITATSCLETDAECEELRESREPEESESE